MPGGTPRIGQQQQPEQSDDLGLVGHQLCEQPGQTNRLGAQIGPDEGRPAARGVALVVDEVEHGQHRPQPVGQVGTLGHAVGDVRVSDLALRPHDALRHRRLGHEERASDLLGLQPSEHAERQGHLCARRQRGVATREDHAEAVVAHGSHLLEWLVLCMQRRGLRVSVVS